MTTLNPPVKKKTTWATILKLFRELQLPSPSKPETWLEFSVLSELLHQPKVIVITTKVLNTALKKIDKDSRHRALVLLTAYVMLMCPSEILQDLKQEQEKKLHDSAQRMLCLFETWSNTHRHSGATAAREAFIESWGEYYDLFEAWKSQDRDELITNMISYYVQLSTLRQTMIGHDEKEGDPLGLQLKEAKNKLEKLGGTLALTQLQRALERSAASTSTGRRRKQDDAKPRTPQLGNNLQVHKDQVNELLSDYASSLTNLQLAHELVLEPDFSLRNYAVHNEFEDKRLLSLAPSRNSLHERIEKDLDMDLIKQQIENNAFDMSAMISYITDTMAKMCAPVRDSQIENIRNLDGKPVEQLKSIHDLLDDMSLDLSNFRLQSLRRPLMTIAVEYEREKFAEMLNSGKIQLVKTKNWLACLNQEKRKFEDAFVSLLEKPEILTADNLPETMMLDVRRMAIFQNEFQANILVATLLTLTRNFGQVSSQKLSELGVKFFTLLEDKETMVDNLVSEIERTVGSVQAEKRTTIQNIIDKALSHTSPIYSILSRRIALVIKNTLKEGRFASEEVNNGLEYINPNLQLLSLRILKLARHHRQVYASWYDELIKK